MSEIREPETVEQTEWQGPTETETAEDAPAEVAEPETVESAE